MLKNDNGDRTFPTTQQKNNLPAAAKRALKEAAGRRKSNSKKQIQKETGGRDGPDPARFGDWEVKGIASDF